MSDYTRGVVHAILVDLPELRALRESVRKQQDFHTDRNLGTLFSLLTDVESAIPHLPPQLREAVDVRYEQARTERECANLLHISKRALCKRIEKAESFIAKFLSEHGTQTPQ